MTSDDLRIHTSNFSEILYCDKTRNKMQENKKIGDLFYKSKVPLWTYAGWGNFAADVNCIRKNPNCYIGILIPIWAETIGFIGFTLFNY